MKNKFTNTTIESIGWYVYLLKDPRNNEVFYVGKGCRNRVFAHVAESIKYPQASDKLARIHEIKEAGYDVIHVIHRHGIPDEATAYEVESAIIDFFPNLTNAVKGYGSLRGPKSIKQINELYDPEIADLDGLKVLMIKINNSYDKMDAVNATCFSWKVNAAKASQAHVVLGVAHGVIRCVLQPKGWRQSCPIKDKELWEHYGFFGDTKAMQEQSKRKVLEAVPAQHDLYDRFMGKAIPAEYSAKGSQQVLRYNY